ncbi:hypothetical protein SAMN05421759_10375 [Roseivivax lentus]|uniref:histidine kinase n=1 Tax=Roseivivax lentus TaxID=633194 RepID=A0A1N7LQU5_9RHOB|nr:PAS domain-containing sensor histidine kinase [Roseivivax lentus]SIS76152.1 hypothetical protein SAMN05421759_10375 [Roseivivax lentus]
MIAASALPRPGLRFSLRGKIVALVVGLVLVSTVMMSLNSYNKARDRELLIALQGIDAVAASGARSLERVLDQMVSDARILADLAPVPYLIAPAGAGDAVTDRQGITADLWRSRLSEVFVNVIEKRPHYTHVRLIGRRDAWRVVARVNQTERGAAIVAAQTLQSTGRAPYIALLREETRTNGFFARVTDQIESGFVTSGPTLRYVQPVTDAAGRLMGAIVINADYAAVLRAANLPLQPGTRVTVVNGSGDTMILTPETPHPRLLRANRAAAPQQGPASAGHASVGDERRIAGTPDGIVLSKIIRAPEDERRFALRAETETSTATLLQRAQSQLRHNLLTSALMVASSGLIALVAGMRLTDPLVSLHRRIASGQTAPEATARFYQNRDEIGDLARAFSSLFEELMRKTRHAMAIFENAAIAIVVIDRHGRLADVNPAACALFGRPAERMVGLPLVVVLPGAATHPVLSGQGRELPDGPIEMTGIGPGGASVTLEVTLRCADGASDGQSIAILRDVTEIRRGQEEVARLLLRLRQSSQELDQFAYVASHDLKAPLRVIDNASRWLGEDLEPYLTDDTRESLDLLRSRVHRMERLLDDLLAHSRVGRTSIDTELVRGDKLIDDVIALLDDNSGIRLEVGPGFDAIEVPRMPLTTVLTNLLNNAIRHHDRPQGCARIEVRSVADGKEFIVSDDGPGIAPDYHDKIFQIFQTLKPRDQMESSGIGLAIVKKYVDLSGGRITVTSDGPRGTTFRVFWPNAASLSRDAERLAS